MFLKCIYSVCVVCLVISSIMSTATVGKQHCLIVTEANVSASWDLVYSAATLSTGAELR